MMKKRRQPIMPVQRPITDPAKQPKTVHTPTQVKLAPPEPKPPCRFCRGTRRVIQKVAAKFFGG